ncbi:alginate export family protein, partial [Patescibacteria group bacterium]|nr:alginate export family protein [Patescibacteria group bacterium]
NNLNKQNLIAYNVFGGFNVTPKLGFDVQFWLLQADRAPTGYVSKDYGYEIDATATYKIYDNLSYMVGLGYFMTGDYFKGTNSSNKVGNDYLLLNKLTLNF